MSNVTWRLKRALKSAYFNVKTLFIGPNNDKIFCLSFQRTGTSSVGEFFKQNGYKVVGWHLSHKLRWSELWYENRFNKIFTSYEFKSSEVFEDSPWFHADFYKELHQKYPGAKFILFERNSDKWFNSMLSHSGGKILGNVFIHTRLYNREDELKGLEGINTKDIRDMNNFNLLPLNESHRKKYITIYEKRNSEVKSYFKDTNKLISLELEDPQKWNKLASFFNIEIDENLEVHANKTR